MGRILHLCTAFGPKSSPPDRYRHWDKSNAPVLSVSVFYDQSFADPSRQPPAARKATDAEAAQLYRRIGAYPGRYKTDGDKLIVTPEVASTSPALVGTEQTYLIEIRTSLSASVRPEDSNNDAFPPPSHHELSLCRLLGTPGPGLPLWFPMPLGGRSRDAGREPRSDVNFTRSTMQSSGRFQ